MSYKVKYDETCFSPISFEKRAPLAAASALRSVTLSPDQEAAHKAFRSWLRHKHTKLWKLGGYAGTGKSLLISYELADLHKKKIVVAALTGRAANNIRQRLIAAGLSSSSLFVMTLHSLLYQCFERPDGKLGWMRKGREAFGAFDLIIVDEASMVGDSMLEHLLSYGVPVWAVGDHGQLPPVGDSGRLMQSPDFRLEKIHRQAESSAIIRISKTIREEGDMPKSPPGEGEVRYVKKGSLAELARGWYGEKRPEEVAVVAWLNETRVETNRVLRQIRWGAPSAIGELPRVGDQVICLKNAHKHAFNGMRGVLGDYAATEDAMYLDGEASFPDENVRYRGTIARGFFDRPKMPETLEELAVGSWDELGLLLDYGYCLTVHKAQGSQFHSVAVLREKPFMASKEMWRRWLYTAVTRAQERLAVLV